MKRFRQIVFEKGYRNGVLGLREIRIPKIGVKSVGCEQSPGKRSLTSQARKHHQTVIAWFWITENRAVPIAAQLYLPDRWCFDAGYINRDLAVADRRRYQYRSGAEIALELLAEIRHSLKFTPPIVVDMAFSEMWPLLSDFFEYSSLVMIHLDPLGQWPWLSDYLGEVAEPGGRGAYECFMHGKASESLVAETIQRQKSASGTALLSLRAAGRTGRILLNRPRYLFLMPKASGNTEAYLSNRPRPEDELITYSENFETMDRCAERILPMLSRFHGRTWRGFHHHICLSAMADMIAVNHF